MSNAQALLDHLYSATYVEDYLDCMEAIPDDIQMDISRMNDLNISYNAEMNDLEETLESFITNYEAPVETTPNVEPLQQPNFPNGNGNAAMKDKLQTAQDLLIKAQSIQDEKLLLSQNIHDNSEHQFHKLKLDKKNLEELRRRGCRRAKEKEKIERARHEVIVSTVDAISVVDAARHEPVTGTAKREPKAGTSGQSRTVSKIKLFAGAGDIASPGSEEPTYCLCDKVSYGNMIFCDNHLCPIEWFHFTCVNLVNKPKGKWYCPKCRAGKSNIMKSKTVFLKELEEYNRENEEEEFTMSK